MSLKARLAVHARGCVKTLGKNHRAMRWAWKRCLCLSGRTQTATRAHGRADQGSLTGFGEGFAPSGGYGRHEPLDPDQGDHALDLVGQHVQRHLGAHVFRVAHQEMGGALIHRSNCCQAAICACRTVRYGIIFRPARSAAASPFPALREGYYRIDVVGPLLPVGLWCSIPDSGHSGPAQH